MSEKRAPAPVHQQYGGHDRAQSVRLHHQQRRHPQSGCVQPELQRLREYQGHPHEDGFIRPRHKRLHLLRSVHELYPRRHQEISATKNDTLIKMIKDVKIFLHESLVLTMQDEDMQVQDPSVE